MFSFCALNTYLNVQTKFRWKYNLQKTNKYENRESLKEAKKRVRKSQAYKMRSM